VRTGTETAYAIHVFHGQGHLEKVYENALARRLRKQGLEVNQQHAVRVQDEDGTAIGDFYADLLVENLLVVELKAVKTLADETCGTVARLPEIDSARAWASH